MVNYNYLLLGNNQADLQHLNKLLTQVPLTNKIQCRHTIGEAIELIQANQYDVVFLDTHLADQSGLSWFHQLPTPPVTIVISTEAHYAVECFDLPIADFLLKPVTLPRLFRAIFRALASPVNHKKQEANQSILLYSGRKLHKFTLDELLYFEAFGASTKIHMPGQTIIVNSPISALEAQLPVWQFQRIQKSFIINLAKVSMLDAKAVWIENTRIPIGLQYRELVRELFPLVVKKEL
ncbi:LytR/AlgR family response regulator transcription factor [Spirosoma endbachense]|uniref:Response regulator n=1 Tax=Spirosoma endbachense TaxID=2666025 RepID=A0A6P1W861_9BACT|nr:LytTR family DNA-binding domain-containing protein [Spirosoma endbachense]QHW01105.1 response regulator [Spirosoma endbachense]